MYNVKPVGINPRMWEIKFQCWTFFTKTSSVHAAWKEMQNVLVLDRKMFHQQLVGHSTEANTRSQTCSTTFK